jgi:hypothetical protein
MDNRPRHLADRMMASRKLSDLHETIILPLHEARRKAREILDESPQDGYMTVVERWRQLPDGQIEFTMRRLRTRDK